MAQDEMIKTFGIDGYSFEQLCMQVGRALMAFEPKPGVEFSFSVDTPSGDTSVPEFLSACLRFNDPETATVKEARRLLPLRLIRDSEEL